MIECSLRVVAKEYQINYNKYMDCPIRLKLLKIQKYRYYKGLYEGRIKFYEQVIKKCSEDI